MTATINTAIATTIATSRADATDGRRTLRSWHDEVRALHSAGRTDEAVDLLGRLVEAVPSEPRLRRDLITLLRAQGRPVDADRLAVELDPNDAGAWCRLSRHARCTQDLDLFVEASLGWEAARPGDPTVAHFAAIARQIRDGHTHARPEAGYIAELFDHYADRFEGHLAKLGYRGPDVVADLVADLIADGELSTDSALADLGCGTGLVGDRLRGATPWNGHLTGVDLSPRMLDHAATRTIDDRPVYDAVAEDDFVDFLDTVPNGLDAVTAADAFIYVGDLRPVFAATAQALRPGGWLVATLERLEPSDTAAATASGFRADLSGRYLHADDWVERELLTAGFDVVVVEPMSVRREGHRPTPGSVVVAHLPRHTR